MGDPVLRVRNLSKRFGENVVLQDVSFDLPGGELLGLMGPSGMGKTVLLKLIMGLAEVDSGEIWFEGVDLARQSERTLSRVRSRIGYVFQNGALFDSLTVEENLSYPLQRHTALDESGIGRVVNQKLRDFGLEGSNDLFPHEISGGMRKRAGLLRATMLSPHLVLFDEPTSGLDPVNVENFIRQILKIREQTGLSGIFVAHDPAAIRALCSRVALLWEGRLKFVEESEIEHSRDFLVKSFFKAAYLEGRNDQSS